MNQSTRPSGQVFFHSFHCVFFFSCVLACQELNMNDHSRDCIVRGPKDHMKTRILHSSSKAQDKEDSRSHSF